MTTLPLASEGCTETSGRPSDRAIPATVRGCSESLNSDTAEEILCSTLVGTARTWRGSRPAPASFDAARLTGAGQDGEAGSARRGGRARTSGSPLGDGVLELGLFGGRLVHRRRLACRRGGSRRCAGGRAATGGGPDGRSTRRTRGPRPRGPSPRAAPATCTARTPSGGRRRSGRSRRARRAAASGRRRRRRLAPSRYELPWYSRSEPTTARVARRADGSRAYALTASLLGPGLVDDLAGEVPGHLLVARELHRELALAAGDRRADRARRRASRPSAPRP